MNKTSNFLRTRIFLITAILLFPLFFNGEIVDDEKVCEAFRQSQEDPFFDFKILAELLGDNTEFICGDQIVTFTYTITSQGDELVNFSYRDIREDIDVFKGTKKEKEQEIRRRLEEDMELAAGADDLAAARSIFEKGMPVNGYDNSGLPLKRAVFFDAVKILEYLIRQGARLPKDKKERTYLLFDAKSDKAAALLIRAGISPDSKGYYGESFLLHAVENNLFETVQYITKNHRYNIHETDQYGQSLLTLACTPGYDETGPPGDRHALIAFLLSLGADANYGHDDPSILSPIIACAENGIGVKTLQLLIDNGADPNTRDFFGWTIFTFPGKGTYRSELLQLQKKYNGVRTIFPRANSALFNAVLNNDVKTITSASAKELESLQGRTPGGIPITPLHLAVIQGDPEMLKVLFKKKVNWNVPDGYGATPLFRAVLQEDETLVKQLLKMGADPALTESTDKNTNSTLISSPLDYAIARNYKIALILINADKKNSSQYGRKAMNYAVEKGDLEYVTFLIKNGIDYKYTLKVSTQDENRSVYEDTLAGQAAEMGHVDVLKYLIKKRVPLTKSKAAYLKLAKKRKEETDTLIANMTGYQGPAYQKSAGGSKTGLFQITCGSDDINFPGLYASDPVEDFPRVDGLPVDVYVPENYQADTKHGLIIFIHGGSHGKPTRAYQEVLKKKNMLWAGFSAYSADKKDIDPGYLAIAAAYYMQKKYNIDPGRIYIGGFSWGGLISSNLLNYYPYLFKGILSMGRAIGTAGFMSIKRPAVLATGDLDFNLPETYTDYRQMLRHGHRKVLYIQEPGMGHQLINADNFARALEYLNKHGNQ